MTAVLPPATEESTTTEPGTSAHKRAATRVKTRRGAFAILRSVLFWTHVVMGVTGGVIIFIMSVTGAALGFEKQLIAKFDGVAQATLPSAAAARLPLSQLVTPARIDSEGVTSIGLKAQREEVVTVRFREREKPALLLDPYTGASIAAVPRGQMAESLAWLKGWHRWLGVTAENRPIARAFTGACNFMFLVLLLSGLYIWWPRRFTKAAYKTAAVFNPRLSGKARDFNWHNSLGFWSAIPLAIVVASGVFMSYQWPGQWMDRLWGSEKERVAAIKAMHTPQSETARGEGAPREGGSRGGGQREGARRSEATQESRAKASLDSMLTAVQTARPEWQAITITLAGPRDSVVQLAVSEGNTYRPDLKYQYYFNAATGVQTRVTNFDSLSTSRKIRAWNRFGHTGEVFGVTGQIIATAVSFFGAILVYTGLALAFRRLRAWIGRRRREAAVVA